MKYLSVTIAIHYDKNLRRVSNTFILCKSLSEGLTHLRFNKHVYKSFAMFQQNIKKDCWDFNKYVTP